MPLIEQGAVLLDATPRWTATRHWQQQYFHKSVMVVLEHETGEDGFTLGMMLNRPSALRLDGWRLWYGGPVGEAGLFHTKDDGIHAEPRKIICLHTREELARLSFPVIRGVWYTPFAGAQELVASGSAAKSDFWTFVGYAGWYACQLEEELEQGLWAVASADDQLRQILEMQEAEPSPSAEVPGDGIGTWETLMRSIGRGELVASSSGGPSDELLAEWIRRCLLPPTPRLDE